MRPTFKSPHDKIPYNPNHIFHTCHVEFHVNFSSTENVMECDPKLPSCKPKVEAHDTLNQGEFKDSQEPWPNDFRVNMP